VAIYDLYSKRLARESAGQTDVYQYDKIPSGLRAQILHIWDDAFGVPYVDPVNQHLAPKIHETYHSIAGVLRREYGVFALSRRSSPNDARESRKELREWFLGETNTVRVLDCIELTFRIIAIHTSKREYINRSKAKEISDEALHELNARFKEHAVGYQLEDEKIVRVDSAFVHDQAVVPVLSVLRGVGYENAQEEFLSAHEHYRHGSYQEALVDCCKAFESTMKIICQKRGWQVDPNKLASSELIKACLDNGLIPPYWTNHFTGLRTILTSGIPTARNRQGGHGAGTTTNDPPAELVSYVLHMTASSILFLAESEKALRP
jgi:AbiJ N-terminal domain 4